MVKNALKKLGLLPQLKYDVEDKFQTNENYYGLIKDFNGFRIHVRKSNNSPMKKKNAGIPFSPILQYNPYPPLLVSSSLFN